MEEEEVVEECGWCKIVFPEEMALLVDDADIVLCPDCYDIWEWELIRDMREARVTGIAQCPNCEHIQPIFTQKTNKHFVRCFRCEAPPKPGKDHDPEELRIKKQKPKEIPRVRMRVRWFDTDMPKSLWEAYFKNCQLV